MKQYEETEAIEHMRNALSPDEAKAYDDDEFLNVIDMIWDYYEQNGMLEIDSDPNDDEDAETIISELTDYVLRMLKKDKLAKMKPEHVKPIVVAEIAYEDSIDDDSDNF